METVASQGVSIAFINILPFFYLFFFIPFHKAFDTSLYKHCFLENNRSGSEIMKILYKTME